MKMPQNEKQAARLMDQDGNSVALQGVKADCILHDLLAEVTVEQRYLNPGKKNIEAVYTFPLPIGAVLLGMEVEIEGRLMAARVVERKQAERHYEEAITEGDSAVMLEEAGPGLFTASIGNLPAGASAVIRYRYGLLLSWQGKQVRFRLPTTIAPRYGNPDEAGLKPHQVPSTSLVAEYPLMINVTVVGSLAHARISCPSHPTSIQHGGNELKLELKGKAYLDRDFVVVFEGEQEQSSALKVTEGEETVALASIRIPSQPEDPSAPLAVKIVFDCSGSMAGVSIAQARKAALELLEQLDPADSFNVTFFGSHVEHLFSCMVEANESNVALAWNRLSNMQADMGGTEMEQALESVFQMDAIEAKPVLLLVTDGQIHSHERVVKRARGSGHRVFTVGVGTAVSEEFLNALADSTGGACELVSPQEGMSECVLGQFHRMRQVQLKGVEIVWPMLPKWQTPLPRSVFAGDTLHVYAGFDSSVTGGVKFRAAGGIYTELTLSASQNPVIPRMAAARRLSSVSEAEGLALALKHQLLSPWTNYLVIDVREQKLADLPELNRVPQMLPAGWGGSSQPVVRESLGRGLAGVGISESVDLKYQLPAFLRKGSASGDSGMILHSPVSSPKEVRSGPLEFVHALERHMTGRVNQISIPVSFVELKALGLSEMVLKVLRALAKMTGDERLVVMAFLDAVTRSELSDVMERHTRREIQKAWKQMGSDEAQKTQDMLMTMAEFKVLGAAWTGLKNVEILTEY